jgi:hypothetical protein
MVSMLGLGLLAGSALYSISIAGKRIAESVKDIPWLDPQRSRRWSVSERQVIGSALAAIFLSAASSSLDFGFVAFLAMLTMQRRIEPEAVPLVAPAAANLLPLRHLELFQEQFPEDDHKGGAAASDNERSPAWRPSNDKEKSIQERSNQAKPPQSPSNGNQDV